MIKATAMKIQPMLFEWDEKFKVQLQAISREDNQKLIKANEEATYNGKHQRVTETNWVKYGKAYLRKAVVGWAGMTYRHLLDICQPIALDPGVKLDDPIEFNEENFAFVLDNHRVEFANFVVAGVDRINDICAEQKKKELENL
jgi:hypothetical protein